MIDKIKKNLYRLSYSKGKIDFLSAPWLNGWVNNREAGDLRHHRAHYDVVAMNKMHTKLLIRNFFSQIYIEKDITIMISKFSDFIEIVKWDEASGTYVPYWHISQHPKQTTGIHDDVIKWKHFPRYWPSVRRIHRSPVNSPHKGQRRGALIFSDLRLNKRLSNSREAGDLRRHRAHYDVIIVWPMTFFIRLRSHVIVLQRFNVSSATKLCDSDEQIYLNLESQKLHD